MRQCQLSDPIVQEMLAVFRQTHGDIPFTLQVVAEVKGPPNCPVHGVCDFDQVPPAVSIRADLGQTELVETLCHELAHVARGHDSGHDETWEEARNELSIRFWSRHFPGSDA
jgi:hypothetical protein